MHAITVALLAVVCAALVNGGPARQVETKHTKVKACRFTLTTMIKAKCLQYTGSIAMVADFIDWPADDNSQEPLAHITPEDEYHFCSHFDTHLDCCCAFGCTLEYRMNSCKAPLKPEFVSMFE